MNGYDFDNTIYDGESLLDFFFFCLSKEKKLVFCFPIIIKNLILYSLEYANIDDIIADINQYKDLIIENKDIINDLVKEFWQKNEHKLKHKYLKKIKDDDLIITACPNFLIDGIKDKINTNNIVSSIINTETGKIEFLCFRENKLTKFKEMYPNHTIDKFYTDSYNDIPLIREAQATYIVKGNKEYKIDKTKIKKRQK